jgi:CBS domain-containing protein
MDGAAYARAISNTFPFCRGGRTATTRVIAASQLQRAALADPMPPARAHAYRALIPYGEMAMPKVREFMTPDVTTVPSSANLTEAARLMRDCDVGVLPVVDGGQITGVVTDRDIVIRGVASGKADATVASVLTGNIVCLSPDDDARDAEQRMAEYNVRRLPVVDGGRLVGIVSVGDLAVRTDEKLAGNVMEQTGPEA